MEHYRTEIERRDFLLATEQKRIESLAKVEEVSEERANDIKQLQAALDALTIKHEEGKDEEGKDEVVKDEDLCVVKKQEKQVSEEEINFYRTPIRALIGDLKMSVTGPIVSGKDKVDIHTPAKVNLQELFDKWFEDGKSNDKNEKTFLFRELVVRNHNHTKKVLWPWNVKMDSELKEIIGNKNTLKDLTAIDEGGPTRAFISAFNDQMGVLSVSIHVPTSWISEEKRTVMPEQKREIRVKLFENGSSCFVPVRDASFEIDMKAYGILPCSQEAAKREIIEKAKKFYRAIGRIFIHIICNDEGDNTVSTISASLLPEMLRNVLLRDIHPASKSYTKRDVLVDVLGMGEKRTFEWIKQEQLMTFEHIGFDQEL